MLPPRGHVGHFQEERGRGEEVSCHAATALGTLLRWFPEVWSFFASVQLISPGEVKPPVGDSPNLDPYMDQPAESTSGKGRGGPGSGVGA